VHLQEVVTGASSRQLEEVQADAAARSVRVGTGRGKWTPALDRYRHASGARAGTATCQGMSVDPEKQLFISSLAGKK
jgi:hypothetical protein